MDKDSRPKRYFWRRLAAFVVDFVLAYVVAVVALTAIDVVTGGDFYYWTGPIIRSACGEAPPSTLIDEINLDRPLAPGWSRSYIVCQHLPVGGKTRQVLTVKDVRKDGWLTKTSWLALPVSIMGDRLDTGLKLDPTVLVAYVLMVSWAWRYGVSPGKRWLKLGIRPIDRVSGIETWRLRRELLRLGPLILLSLPDVVWSLVGWWLLKSLSEFIRLADLMTDYISVFVIISTVFGFGVTIYYVFPFLRWRGQTFYDRLAGTMVMKD